MKPNFLSLRATGALLLLSATAFSQETKDPATAELLARVESARGTPAPVATEKDTLSVEGTVEVRFAETGETPMETGTFREAWAGRSAHRHVTEMSGISNLERGLSKDAVWEIEPNTGVRVHSGADATALARWVALQRGAPAKELYKTVAGDGTRELDGTPHAVLKLTTAEGSVDTWWIEPKTARIARIDIELPTPRDCVIIFGFAERSEVQVRLTDWKDVDGAAFPCRRVVKTGSMEITLIATKVERGVEIDKAFLALPAAVAKAVAQRGAVDSPYEIIERAAQPVATIRFQCKSSEFSAKLASVFPEVLGYLTESSTKMAGVPFSYFHSVDGDTLDVEAGIPVASAIEGKGRVQASQLPAGRTLMTWHSGPYDGLKAAHAQLREYAAAQKLTPRGGLWEVYWTDPGMVPDPAKWKTQLFLPVE